MSTNLHTSDNLGRTRTGTPHVAGYVFAPPPYSQGRTKWEKEWEAKCAPAFGLMPSDMPGCGYQVKLLNFFLFRRGLLVAPEGTINRMERRKREIYLRVLAKAKRRHMAVDAA